MTFRHGWNVKQTAAGKEQVIQLREAKGAIAPKASDLPVDWEGGGGTFGGELRVTDRGGRLLGLTQTADKHFTSTLAGGKILNGKMAFVSLEIGPSAHLLQ